MKHFLFAPIAAAALSYNAFASPLGADDFGNAPAPYGSAQHDQGDWQHLGSQYRINDGVSWSVDGGHTFGTTAALTQGENVTFKFVLNSHNIGGHISDPLRVWMDWDNSGVWSNAEMIYSTKYIKADNNRYWIKATPENPTPSGENYWNGRHWEQGVTGQWVSTTYILNTLVPTNAAVGNTWLRARATCDASLGGADWQRTWSDYSWDAREGDINNLTPYGYLHQGEVEDYRLRILSKRIVPVPEGAAGVLLGLGLFGLVLRRKF